MPKEVTIKFKPTPKQKEVLQGSKRFTLWRAGRRGAKTHLAVYKQGKYALLHAKTRNWYVAQDTSLLNEEIMPLFESIFGEVIKDYSASMKRYTLVNDSLMYFKSANSNNSLRGRALDSLVAEECVYWKHGGTLFHDTLRPQLVDRLGWSIAISSPPSKKCPVGAEWFRRLEQMYLEEIKAGSTEYSVFHSTIYDNPHMDRAEIDKIRAKEDPDTWQIEYMGEYCDKVGQVYWEYDPLTKKLPLDTKEPVLMRVRGMDFGIADNTACAFVCLLNGNRIHIEDEYVANNLDVPSHARAIRAKTILQPAWTILDSACWARDATLSSVAKRFAAEGINSIQGTKDLDGSISDLKLMFSQGLITIDPKCTNMLQAIESWQHGTHEPDILAASRYAIDALIRGGKLMPPVRKDAPMLNVIHLRDELEKRMNRLNAALDHKARFGNNPAIRVYK